MTEGWRERPWEKEPAAQARAVAAEKASKSGRGFAWGCLAVVAAIPLLFVIGAIWNRVTGDDGSTGDKTAAYLACKQAATARLTNPATVDFQVSAISITEVPGGFRVEGPLKARTGFGVEQNLRFTCSTTSAGTVTSIEVR